MSPLQAMGRAAAVVLAGLLAITALSACGPSKPKYVFSAVTSEIAMDGESTIDVRLIDEATGQPVENAVIFETRFDMSPDAMGAMTSPVTAQESPAPGVYRFAVKPTMAGRWQLTLGAKVQGEPETARGAIVVTAR